MARITLRRIGSNLAVLTLIALAAVACSDTDEPSPTGTPIESTAPTASATSDAAVSGPSGGGSADVEDCGVEALGPGGERELAMRECVWNAYEAGQAAVFTSIMTTMEGDEVPWHLAVIASDEIRVTMDNSKDRFAGPNAGVHEYTCSAMTPGSDPQFPMTLELSGCEAVEGEPLPDGRLSI